MLGAGEPCAKKAKYEKQKIYNDKRKEKPRKPQFSLNFQFNFGEEEEMRATNERFVRLRNMANLRCGRSNADFLQALMDRYEGRCAESPKEMHSVAVQANATESIFELYAEREAEKRDFQCQWPCHEEVEDQAPACRQILSPARVTENFFVCGQDSLAILLQETAKGCPCGSTFDENMKHMDGHVLRMEISCENGHRIKWASSSILGNKYTANCRVIHGFTSSGMLESQYQGFAEAAKLGSVGDKYIDYVYDKMGYMGTVNNTADTSQADSIQEVKNTATYQDKNGATVITDCRHDSTANAYHSTVAMLSYETQHVVAVQTVTKEEFRSPQTHEFEAMQKIIPAVQAKGLTVIEVAHDFVPKIKNWLLAQHINNSFDTWHGTKGVAKAMKEISVGAQKWEGQKWFAELSDKQASVKRHFYYSMKNCQNPDDLRRRLLTIVDHYQGNHSGCDPESKCKVSGYRCSKVKLTNPGAIAALRKFIVDSKVYKLAEDYYLCRDTYWVESFNNVILIYCPKRIHFADRTFNMRIALAVMDWNENINREATSVSLFQDVRRPTRRTGHKNLLPKTFQFRELIWTIFFQLNY